MENHPIPQDVTGFQFKLVGNMTLKQFGYVGAGVILSAVFVYAPVAWFVKLLLVPFFALTGISLAFLPIEGRPMDLIASYFFMALIKPNQYIYQKAGGALSFLELNLRPVIPQITQVSSVAKRSEPQSQRKEEQLLTYLYNTSSSSTNPLDQRENQLLSSLFTKPIQTQPAQASSYFPSSLNAQNNTGISPSQNNQAPTQTLNEPSIPIMPKELYGMSQTPVLQMPANESSAIPVPKGSQSSQLSAPLDETSQPDSFTMQPLPPSTVVQVVPATENTLSSVIKPTGFEFPNLAKGIVRDSRGNVLSGILVEVNNPNGDSVRAFKTNALGQFTSATQLANGKYMIVFEDPKGQHRFDTVQIEASGTVLPTMEIVSIDAREELRRSLFGQ